MTRCCRLNRTVLPPLLPSHFVYTSELGSGGFARVVEARDTRIVDQKSTVAIKMIPTTVRFKSQGFCWGSEGPTGYGRFASSCRSESPFTAKCWEGCDRAAFLLPGAPECTVREVCGAGGVHPRRCQVTQRRARPRGVRDGGPCGGRDGPNEGRGPVGVRQQEFLRTRKVMVNLLCVFSPQSLPSTRLRRGPQRQRERTNVDAGERAARFWERKLNVASSSTMSCSTRLGAGSVTTVTLVGL